MIVQSSFTEGIVMLMTPFALLIAYMMRKKIVYVKLIKNSSISLKNKNVFEYFQANIEPKISK